MTTIRDVRNAVRPLIERRDDLFSMGRFVFIKPVRHILRGVHFESRRDPKIFGSRLSVQSLVPALPEFGLGWGERFYPTDQEGRVLGSGWDAGDPEMVSQMLDTAEEVLAQLHAIDTFDDYHSYLSGLQVPWIASPTIELSEVMNHAMKGEFASACEKLESSDRSLKHLNTLTPRFHKALQAEDRAEVAQILHDWEAATVKTYKIGKFWERTPFPLELR
ncbi:hypothetical protein HQ945_11170 [Phyllobacterium sp. BT25]|uniref:Uncharacterized protein n=1 Tax=Phyllobacterium pellucidum TaxID=2740464 RepID=A0A849VNX2_9HYPH|nr:hypothetical protein [Phyllobacterium pellucidum]NTS31815.1 hypothetical protein [Phyllobacterium pellucidum]